jgi:type IV secretion system protein VirB4
VIKLSRILKDYEESGALNALVNVHAAVDEHTFLTKSGDLLVVLAVQGIDYECLDHSEVDQLTRRFESAVRIFDENFRFYQYLVKRDNASIPYRHSDHPVVEEAIANRMAYLQEKANRLYSLEIYAAIVYEGWRPARDRAQRLTQVLTSPLASLPKLLSSERSVRLLEGELERACQVLANKAKSLVIQLEDAIHLEILDKQRAYHFLRRLLNYTPYKVDGVRLKYDSFVDFQACDSALECHQDHLRLDDYDIEVLTLKEPPAHTFAHLLKGLHEIHSNYIIASEWKRESNLKMRKLIQSKRRHFHNAKASMTNYLTSGSQAGPKDMLIDSGAVALVSDLGACLEELEVKGHYFGQFSLTIVLYDKDRAALKRSVADCFKVFATQDAQLTEERYNLLNAWLAILPGNQLYNLRSLRLLNTNYADLSFLLTQRTGEPHNAHLGAEYLAVLESEGGLPYFLNLHYQDNAHSVILGATGSGKSFLLNFLLTNLQKYAPRTYIFDLGGSYENLTRLFEGSYLRIGIESRSLSINPFSLAPTKENLHFLHSFLKVLVESGGYQMTALEDRDLYEQIENIYSIEPEQRRLFILSNVLNRNLRTSLQKWVDGGPYASLFDNVKDNLTLSTFQTFDFEGMDKYPEVLEPLLFYILHRANAVIYDEQHVTTFKAFVMDEAWRFFRHPTIRLYIVEALKTWRKKNAAMILATQSSDDLLRSEILPVIVESCATRMFLANPGIDQSAYRATFHLNETEAALIAGLVPKRQILVKRPDLAKVVNLTVDPKSYWLYTNRPYDNQRRREAFERFGFQRGLEILAGGNPS